MSWSWHAFWLFLHIYAAIIAFGPTFVFPLVGPMLEKNPQHALFGFRIFEVIENRLVVPVALTMPISGVGLIATTDIAILHTPWLLAGVILYVIALGIALLNQVPATAHAIGILEGAHAGDGGGEGPPAGLQAQVNRARIGGMILALLLITIVILMVTKPGTTALR